MSLKSVMIDVKIQDMQQRKTPAMATGRFSKRSTRGVTITLAPVAKPIGMAPAQAAEETTSKLIVNTSSGKLARLLNRCIYSPVTVLDLILQMYQQNIYNHSTFKGAVGRGAKFALLFYYLCRNSCLMDKTFKPV